MDLRKLRYFIAIVELGSFSKAAAKLRVAQPALSLHVKNMEEDLGAKLLFRAPSGVTMTEAGKILLRNARIISEQFQTTKEEIQEQAGDPTGEVRIGIPGTISQNLIVPLVINAKLKFPKINIHISEAMSGFVLEWLQDARIDLAVLYVPVTEGHFESDEVLKEELWVLGPSSPMQEGRTHPPPGELNFREVLDLPLILPSSTHDLRVLLETRAKKMDQSLSPLLEMDSYGNIKELVEAGLGYSILPFNSISREVSAGRLLAWRIAGPRLERSIYIVHPSDRLVGNATRAIRQLCADTLITLAQDGKWKGAHLIEKGSSPVGGRIRAIAFKPKRRPGSYRA